MSNPNLTNPKLFHTTRNYYYILQATLMMLSPLLPLLKPPDMAWKADTCLAGGGFWSDGDVDSFRDKGKGSTVGVWFKLRSAIFEDGGTGTGRMRLGEQLASLMCPRARLSTESSPVTGNTAGKVEITGNPLRWLLRCGCDMVSCWIWSSSIVEIMYCQIWRKY